jgi:hypothetical protein
LISTIMQQLDIFADSRDVMLRNDVLESLQRRDPILARTALAQLASEYPDDGALPALAVLVGALENAATVPFTDREMLAAARRTLEDEVVPAARRVLPAQAVEPWLASCWRTLAKQAAPLAFSATDADHYAAALWLFAHDWDAARESVERIESWWRIPAPLGWMSEARYRSDGLDAAWPLLGELAWLAPARFAALLAALGDASLDALRRRFDAEFPGAGDVGDYRWFPAWLLVIKPGLAARLGEARTQRDIAGSRATALLGEILRREREGDQHELVGLRQELSRLHAGLFDVYMATRTVQHR